MKNGSLPIRLSQGCFLLLLLISFVFPLNLLAQQFFVSPTGNSNGNGSQTSPWDLQTALKQPSSVKPGSTIFLLGGTYKGNYTSSLNGTATQPIIVKSQPGEHVIIDGNLGNSKNSSALLIQGSYTWFQGFEIMNSNPNRILSTTGSDPLGSRGDGLTVYGVGIKIINMIIHDNANGIGAWSVATDNEYYGNLIYNNGWIATDRNHGHGIYTQNNTGTKNFGDNIILNNLSYGVQAYGSATAPLNNFNFDGNALFNDRWLLGGSAPAKNITVNNNFTYADTIEFGYAPVANTGLTLTNNIFSSTIEIRYWNNVVAKNNTIYDGSLYRAPLFLLFNGTPDYSTFQFNNNTYYWSNPAPAGVAKEPQVAWSNATAADTDPNKSGTYLLSQWKQMGKDAQSTIQYFPQQSSTQMALSGVRSFLRKNKYDPTRSNLIIYNYSKTATVQVNADGFLSPGDSYELHNALNYFGDVIKGTYAGGTLSVPMTGHSMVNPLGLQSPMGCNTFPEFGTFILIKTAAGSSTNPPAQPFGFTSFTSEQANSDVALKWSVENNQNTTGFTVERSGDNSNFSAIATIPVTTDTNYSFTNTNLAAGTYYYRIKRMAGNDPAVYSSVISATVNPSSVSSFNFLDFYLTPSGSNVAVQWVTPQEYGSKSFTVERSSDGVNFTPLSTITANANPQASNVYGYLDETPPAGQYSYRIKRTGTDNSITYSAIKQITVGAPTSSSFNFLDFTVQQLSSGIAVQWTTGLEYDSRSFTVERSSNGGSTFNTMTVINASANPQASNVYGYLDATPAAGTYSYRIKRLAKDNSVSYSAVKQITIGSTAVSFSILQNPVTSSLALQVNAPGIPTALQFRITDATGQARYTEQITASGSFTHNIAVSQLQSGTYYISIYYYHSSVTKQFMKQ